MKVCAKLIDSFLSHLKEGFSCSEEGPYIVICTPFQYSDGDYIYLYVEKNDKELIVSDLGETYRKLATYNFNWRTIKARSIYADILNKTGVSSYQGKLFTRIINLSNSGESILDLLQAVQNTNDMLYVSSNYRGQDFRDKVEREFLKNGLKPELNYQIIGYSGNLWRIPFYFNHSANLLSKAISFVSKGGVRNLIGTTYTAYDDIKKAHTNIKRTIIIDDTEDSEIEQESINLLKQVSDMEIGYWSRKERYIELISEIVERK